MAETSRYPLPIIESQVTYLEMIKNPRLEPKSLEKFKLERDSKSSLNKYLNIYREVGRDYIWNYRPGQTTDVIEEIIQSSSTWLYYLSLENNVVGLAEIDANKPKDIELVHFGLIPQFLHKGIGKDFLNNILALVWKPKIERIWLSTCGMDHPNAISFYEKAGFSVFKTKVAEFKDYRFSSFYDLNDAPQIPHGIIKD